jgi:hypothetical protein
MHLDNLIFILLIAMAALFRLLASKSTKTSNKTELPRTNQPPPQVSSESDQERIRRFLEALGQPTSSTPPAPVAPRPTYQKPIVLPRARSIGSPLPPLTTRPPDLPGEMPPPSPRQVSPVKSPLASVPVAAPPVFEVHTSVAAAADTTPVQPTPEPAESSVDLVNLLGSASALRNAIILREIFGPPRSLQRFDLIGN